MSSFVTAEGGTNPFLPADYDIIWSIIPFAIILAFFVFFVIPKFRAILDDRARVIEGGIAKAESAQAEAAAALEQYNAQLREGRAEAAQIREQARVEGAAILAEFKENAAAEAARITANAHLQIEAERQAAVLSLRSEVGSLAIDLASGVIGESLSDDEKASAVVDRFLAELESTEKAKAGE
jgi:F-type H+-transporting ATPase subunit b